MQFTIEYNNNRSEEISISKKYDQIILPIYFFRLLRMNIEQNK